jgi:hemerythrin-like domain-containing protein
VFHRRIVRRLHEDHLATLGHWGRIEQALAAHDQRALEPLLRHASDSIGEELAHHIAFEELELFPRLAAFGHGELADMLCDEHMAIRFAATRFRQVLTLRGAASDETRHLAALVAERLITHIQKEERSLLPVLERLLDDTADREMLAHYRAT